MTESPKFTNDKPSRDRLRVNYRGVINYFNTMDDVQRWANQHVGEGECLIINGETFRKS